MGYQDHLNLYNACTCFDTLIRNNGSRSMGRDPNKGCEGSKKKGLRRVKKNKKKVASRRSKHGLYVYFRVPIFIFSSSFNHFHHRLNHCIKKVDCWHRGVTTGSKGGTIPRAPNHCGEHRKSQPFHKYFLQYSKFPSERPQVWTWGRQTCFLPRAPSNLVTPLCWHGIRT